MTAIDEIKLRLELTEELTPFISAMREHLVNHNRLISDLTAKYRNSETEIHFHVYESVGSLDDLLMKLGTDEEKEALSQSTRRYDALIKGQDDTIAQFIESRFGAQALVDYQALGGQFTPRRINPNAPEGVQAQCDAARDDYQRIVAGVVSNVMGHTYYSRPLQEPDSQPQLDAGLPRICREAVQTR